MGGMTVRRRLSRGVGRSVVWALLGIWSASAVGQDGSLDPTFGVGGIVRTPLPYVAAGGSSVELHPDGRIVVAGGANDGPNWSRILIARYEPNGEVDTSFAINGILETDFGRVWSFAADLRIQADGRILVAGSGGPPRVICCGPEDDELALARFNSDGSRDPSFGEDGVVRTNLDAGGDYANSMSVLPDGRILVAGRTRDVGEERDYALLARYLPDGTLDSTFGNGGLVRSRFHNTARNHGFSALSLMQDGRIVACGNYGDSPTPTVIARYLPDGQPDSTFSVDGYTVGSSYTARSIAVTASGAVLVSGTSSIDEFVIARFTTQGALDPAFGSNGYVRTRVEGRASWLNGLALLVDGRIVAAGRSHDPGYENMRMALARYVEDGTLDASFSEDGQVTTAVGASSSAGDVAIQVDGRIVAAGSSTNVGAPGIAVVRYLSTATSVDPRPGTAGLALSVVPNPSTTFIVVRLASAHVGPVEFTIVDALGRDVASASATSNGSASVQVDVASLPPGLYIMMASDGARLATRPFVIRR